MDDSIKKNLLKQVELLQQKSENANTQELIELSKVMVSLASLWAGSQFPGGVGLNCQYVTPLPLEDLLAIHAARVQRMNHPIARP